MFFCFLGGGAAFVGSTVVLSIPPADFVAVALDGTGRGGVSRLNIPLVWDEVRPLFSPLFFHPVFSLSLSLYVYVYIYIYILLCTIVFVCLCVFLLGKVYLFTSGLHNIDC